ncbi:MAG: TerC/Alx family metal homeostasis membrane protein [Propionibacteriaceae bacterium]|nr:TerC/Alx family metal homeostasis membrane protein [Propionibacteriaceae bacterium]
MDVGHVAWIVTLLVLIAILAFDVLVIGRKPHEPSTRECVIAISLYISGALAFAGFVGLRWGARFSGEFIAGWITEYSLSIDNLFIFIIIMARMRVPRQLQQYALMVGIMLALVFRGVFIAAGAAAIEAFAWVFFIFGVFLLYTALGLFREYFNQDRTQEVRDNLMMRWVRKKFTIADEFHGKKLRISLDGHKVMTPMFFVIIALGSTDLLFAFDSIPAIYGLTQEPYLVFTANVFALMGLRQLYFLIGGLLKRLRYLSVGLSVVLAFIGVKLILHALHHYGFLAWEVPLVVSLVVIIATLLVTTIASLMATSWMDSNEIHPDRGEGKD